MVHVLYVVIYWKHAEKASRENGLSYNWPGGRKVKMIHFLFRPKGEFSCPDFPLEFNCIVTPPSHALSDLLLTYLMYMYMYM